MFSAALGFLDIQAQQARVSQRLPQFGVEVLCLLLEQLELVYLGEVREDLLGQLLHAGQFF